MGADAIRAVRLRPALAARRLAAAEAAASRRRARTSVQARVVRVVDGDTIVASVEGADQYVRYIGVDTPETVKPGTPVQCYGDRRRARRTTAWSTGRTVRLVFDRERRDVYGRLLAYVYTDAGPGRRRPAVRQRDAGPRRLRADADDRPEHRPRAAPRPPRGAGGEGRPGPLGRAAERGHAEASGRCPSCRLPPEGRSACPPGLLGSRPRRVRRRFATRPPIRTRTEIPPPRVPR